MELRQLEYLVAVAEEANFTRAAERVHITQSGISAQIRRLEEDLGATLFDRSGRTARLTSAGEAAVAHARSMLASADALRRSVDDVTEVIRGRLVVGMVSGCTIAPLFDALGDFHRAHPGVDLSLVEDTSDVLLADVRRGASDVALVGTAGAPPDGFEVLPIIREPIAVAVAAGHPLHGRRRVGIRALCAHRLVALPEGTGIRGVLDRSAEAAGATPDVVLDASAPDAVIDLARRGLGAAVLSASMLDDEPDLHVVAIDGLVDDAVLAFAWTAPSPALRAFLDRCRTAFGLAEGRAAGA